MSFKSVDSNMNLPKTEEEILKFWDEKNIFAKTLEKTKDAPTYTFYDGPPFATGTPHYGHIVASTLKDVVPRFWTMKGKRVDRKWGWDCHGLPIENIAEKELGFTHKKEIIELGVDKFNAICRSKVLAYVSDWEKVIRRLGRWADMENAYRTMDLSYMESVWWVFKELWDKDLIYEGYRSMHICPRCETTLSQSEVAEGYRDVKDLSVIAKFELVDEPGTYVLAWTTTPWTLIGNVALAVGENINYVKGKVTKDGQNIGTYITSAGYSQNIYPKLLEKEGESIEWSGDLIKGSELVGKKYKPLFDYYAKPETKNFENGWKIYSAKFVTDEDGTGIVHIAPAFGEDDLELGQKENLPFVQHIGMDGIIKAEAKEFAGMHVKPIEDVQQTDVEIIKYLASKNLLFHKEKFEHSYPHCWRCDTPLLNFATSSWFVAVTKIKADAIELAEDINWSPAHIKEGRFGKWLEGARDWSISRQRFWASVIPIWKCEKCAEYHVIGSVAELEKLSGQKITDIHKDVVDTITFPCSKCDGEMKRIPDVLDTWFDSGSMPYAQFHYPFENKEKFEASFPADFIAEGVDQTRAWFYYLHTLSSAIKKSPSFRNVVVNGIVLAKDGKKMSKKLQNYPDPMLMFDKHGADVMRYYLLSSPVMSAENLSFQESEMAEISRGMFRMLWNSYSFFVLYAEIDNWKTSQKSDSASKNILDRWIISELNQLISDVDESMQKYELNRAVRALPKFIDNLSNWYIRRSRKRFWKSENDGDKENAYQTLHTVLAKLSVVMAPFTPFISEEIFKNLSSEESVHLQNFPVADKKQIDPKLNLEMDLARAVVEAGLSERAAKKIKVRQPLKRLTYHGTQVCAELEEIIADEVNVKEVEFGGPKADKLVELDIKITKELRVGGFAREIIRNIQALRKKTDFNIADRILVFYESSSEELVQAMLSDIVAKEVLAKSIQKGRSEIHGEAEYVIDERKIWIGIRKA